MKKCKIILCLSILLIPLIVWGATILKCEILTYCYYEQFENVYQEETMIDDIDYLKVLAYSSSSAKVYYVSEDRMSGDIVTYVKIDGKWKKDTWNTIWSKQGSAEGYVWPYIR